MSMQKSLDSLSKKLENLKKTNIIVQRGKFESVIKSNEIMREALEKIALRGCGCKKGAPCNCVDWYDLTNEAQDASEECDKLFEENNV